VIIITSAHVADIAEQAVTARRGGMSIVTINGTMFDLDTGGWCARFVRQCHEAAIGGGEWAWEFGSATAYEMERKLILAEKIVDDPVAGDIVGMSTAGKPPGHVAIYAGGGYIYENTSATRGTPSAPGTKLSKLGSSSVTNYYRVLPNTTATVDVDDYAKNYVDWARTMGLMVGYPDGSFGGRQPVSRQDLAIVIARLVGFLEKNC